MNVQSNTKPENTTNWEEQKLKLKAKYPALTDADLQFESGKKDDMLDNLQTKLGKTRKELDEALATL